MRALRHLLLSLILVSAAHAWTGGFGGGGGGGGGSGDVVGPGSSTDNAAAAFDGTTGKVLQERDITFPDDGSVTLNVSSTCGAGTSGRVTLCYDSGGTGDLSARVGLGALVSLEAGGTGAEFAQKSFAGAGAGPYSLDTAFVGGNGHATVCLLGVCDLLQGTDFTISGTSLTIVTGNIPYTISSGIIVRVRYQTQ
jgi:hypothetical protein